MGDLDGIGDAVTGAMLARAVEPQAGEVGRDGHTQERNCLNCGCRLVGDFCHCCGQKAHIHRSIRAFIGDFAPRSARLSSMVTVAFFVVTLKQFPP